MPYALQELFKRMVQQYLGGIVSRSWQVGPYCVMRLHLQSCHHRLGINQVFKLPCPWAPYSVIDPLFEQMNLTIKPSLRCYRRHSAPQLLARTKPDLPDLLCSRIPRIKSNSCWAPSNSAPAEMPYSGLIFDCLRVKRVTRLV